MDDTLEILTPRRRQSPVTVQEAREVRATISPVVHRIGSWQRFLTMLRAKIGRGGANDLRLVGTCRNIAQEVASARRVVASRLPERLRGHGRVVDLERSLQTVERAATKALHDLGY